MRRLAVSAIAALALATTAGCGTLVSPSTLISMATSVFGGYANGAVMGGSVVGVVRDKAMEGNTATAEAANPAEPPRAAEASETPSLAVR
jgi:hypothetical protein